MLLELECANGLLQSDTVVGTLTMSTVQSVFAVIAEQRNAMCASADPLQQHNHLFPDTT